MILFWFDEAIDYKVLGIRSIECVTFGNRFAADACKKNLKIKNLNSFFSPEMECEEVKSRALCNICYDLVGLRLRYCHIALTFLLNSHLYFYLLGTFRNKTSFGI